MLTDTGTAERNALARAVLLVLTLDCHRTVFFPLIPHAHAPTARAACLCK